MSVEEAEFGEWCDQEGGEYDRSVSEGDVTHECDFGYDGSVELRTGETRESYLAVDMGGSDGHLVNGRHYEWSSVRLAEGVGYSERYLAVEGPDGDMMLMGNEGYAGDIEDF